MIAFVKIWALYMTIRMRTGRVAWWYSCPSINNTPRDFIRYVPARFFF